MIFFLYNRTELSTLARKVTGIRIDIPFSSCIFRSSERTKNEA